MIYDFKPFYKNFFVSSYKKVVYTFEACLKEVKCPICNTLNSLSYHAGYWRAPICDYDGEKIIVHKGVYIYRYECSHCGHTHALLTWSLPAYSRHSLRLILYALKDYYSRSETGLTVEKIAEKYHVTCVTIYNWLKRYEKSYITWQRLIEMVQSGVFQLLIMLQEYACDDKPDSFKKYLEEYGFGFMTARQDAIRPLSVAPT
jgi:transposase-like protein